jgi:hypothetical protein
VWSYNTHMKFRALLDRWKQQAQPVLTAREYAVRLPLDDASRLHALAELFPGNQIEGIVTDLLHTALDELSASIPYEAGSKIISRDDQGDPVYEDRGLTPRFIEISRKYRRSLK